jgi:pimeloyl-ACP methyl ester carboxylesterase
MATFVLIHGGWRGGWIWKRVARQLRTDGHDVYTPTLTGLADRKHLLHAGINLSTHVEEIANLIKFEELRDVVLCGHSYSGMVISAVADQLSERVSSLVYLDAWFPRDGDSIMTLSPMEFQLMHIREAGQHAGIACPPIPAKLLNVNDRDRAWVDEMATPHPLATMTESIGLNGSHLQIRKKMYVLASAWNPNPFERFYQQLRTDPAWTTRTIASGHDAMLDDPSSVVELLRTATPL